MQYSDKLINNVMDYNNFKLKDIYKTIYTMEKSRLDRFYISEHLITKIDNVKHDIYLNDHKTVEIDINMEKIKKWGKEYWKLNNQYLKDKNYLEEIKNEINKMQEDFCEISADKWEAIKVKILKGNQ